MRKYVGTMLLLAPIVVSLCILKCMYAFVNVQASASERALIMHVSDTFCLFFA